MNTITTPNGKVFSTPRGFIARPNCNAQSLVKTFNTKGEAVQFLHRVAVLQERISR